MKSFSLKILFLFLAFFCFYPFLILYSQTINDTLTIDSLKNIPLDTLKRKSQVETIIYYKSQDSIRFDLTNKMMYLYQGANIRYKEMELNSGEITINFQQNTLKAVGISVRDTSDTNKTITIASPVLKDRNEEYRGSEVEYNFKTQQGNIIMGKTNSDGQYYFGEKIKRLDPQTYLVKDGTFTTCDAEHPHFYFFSREMKLILGEQIITRWVWLFFGDVPFPIPLPFGVFPNQSGRRSGIIPPTYGQREGMGRYFSGFGYYWAISDYMDINFTGNYYTRGGYAINSNFRYAKKYEFSGSLGMGYSRLLSGEKTDKNYSVQSDYRISLQHSHIFNPYSRMDANLSFVSSNYFSNNSTSINDLINNQIVSNATYYNVWENSGVSVSLGYNRVQNISSGDISEVLPSVNLSVPQFYPFKRDISGKAKSGESLEESWYEQIAVNYNSSFLNRRTFTKTFADVRAGINHSFSASFNSKIGYFNISPRINFNEIWYSKQIEKTNYISYMGYDSLVTNDIDKFGMLHTFDLGIGLNTKFYGMFRPDILGISALRHTVTPSISYSYRPDFSKPFWNYYKTYKTIKGNEIKYSIFEREVFGGASAGEQQAINFSLGNNFEMKLKNSPQDTVAEQQKLQLMNVDMGISYNFAADSLRFSDLRVNFFSNVAQFLSIGGSANFTLYKFVDGVGLVNKYLLSEGTGFLRLTNFNISLSTSLSSEQFKTSEKPKKDTVISQGVTKSLYEQIKEQERETDYSIPWNISLNYNFSLNQFNPNFITRYSNIGLLMSFSLTKAWKVSVSGSYDFIEKQISAPVVRISRDLHCWDMNFEWYPIGYYRGFRFVLKVKAPQLQDLKLEKSGGVFSR